MKLNVFAAFVLIVLSLSARAVDWNLDLPAMRTFLGELKASGQLPARQLSEATFSPSSEAIDTSYRKIFEDLEQRIFGTQSLITLSTCNFDCGLMTDYQTKTVFVQPSFVKAVYADFSQEDATVILQFMTAHELSHLVQEASIGRTEKAKSINGFVSLYDQTELFVRRVPIEEIFALDLPAHAEVDAYALLVLRQFIKDKPVVILREFDRALAADREKFEKTHDPMIKRSDEDIKYRRIRAEILINKLWD